jgi:glycosyltransferase involved in cell wall biosynthesis
VEILLLTDCLKNEPHKGFGHVYGRYLTRHLNKAGCHCTLFSFNTTHYSQLPDADHCIIIKGRKSILANEDMSDWLVKKYGMVHSYRDGPPRGLFPVLPFERVCSFKTSIGVDPELFYPEQDENKPPIVLFNTARDCCIKNEGAQKHIDICTRVLSKLEGVRIWGLGVGGEFVDKVIGGTSGNCFQDYIPWEDVAKVYRKAHVFVDATPRIYELGRIEAAACGATVVFPEETMKFYPYTTIMGCHDYYTYWDEQSLHRAIKLALGGTKNRLQIHRSVVSNWKWEDVAKGTIEYLKGAPWS